MNPILNSAVTAVREASKIILHAIDRVKFLQIEEKSPNDFVTSVDKQVEESIVEFLQKRYPDHSFLCEEMGMIGENEDAMWIIDPLDGTANFIQGIPHYAISIAFRLNGKIEHAVIYDPFKQDLFTASRGKGAQLNGHKIRVSKQNKFECALLATGFAFKDENLKAKNLKTLKPILTDCRDVRRMGAASLDLAYVACGRVDGFWELGLNSWDIAAGALIVKEAGGIVCDPNGGEDYLKYGDIVAAPPRIIKPILKHINSAIKSKQIISENGDSNA